jgi:hypothetical protein
LFFERVRARLLAAIIISCRTWVRRLPWLRHGICGPSSSRGDRSMAGSCLERSGGATTGATGFLRNSVSTPLTQTNDRRSIGRTKIAKGALLFFSGQTGVRSCCVTDITNAGIRAQGIAVLPLNFELSFDHFRTIRQGRLRDGDFVGAAFEG